MSTFYDREGNLLLLFEWATLLENPEYQIVIQEKLENKLEISTVWLGVNYNFRLDEPPHIFETVVFKRDELNKRKGIDCERYSTEEQAREGHKRLKEKYSLISDIENAKDIQYEEVE
jgi:hypothetical protein